MPSAHRSLTPDDVRRFVAEECFATSSDRVGAEVEWLIHDAVDPGAPAPYERARDAVDRLGALPGGSTVTFEPGGQIELSSAPASNAGETCERLARDAAALIEALQRDSVTLTAAGLDPIRGHRRVLHLPRYAAMEHYFDGRGPEGRRMMCRTAAIQVNVDAGRDARRRWSLLHDAGPVLAAIFANSPFFERRSTGWRSTRLATWWSMDPTRTRPARADDGTDPIEAWSKYVLGARVMFVRVRPDWYEPIARPTTFAEWMEHGHEQGFPTIDDVRYHTTTLFPPVRPRGWLEARMIDALPDPWWRVAIAVTATLVNDDETGERARAACGDARRLWVTASRCSLEDPSLAKASRDVMKAVLAAMHRVGVDATTQRAALAFAERYTFRGRSPSDDALDAWHATGRTPASAHAATGTDTMEPAWT